MGKNYPKATTLVYWLVFFAAISSILFRTKYQTWAAIFFIAGVVCLIASIIMFVIEWKKRGVKK